MWCPNSTVCLWQVSGFRDFGGISLASRKGEHRLPQLLLSVLWALPLWDSGQWNLLFLAIEDMRQIFVQGLSLEQPRVLQSPLGLAVFLGLFNCHSRCLNSNWKASAWHYFSVDIQILSITHADYYCTYMQQCKRWLWDFSVRCAVSVAWPTY